MRREHFERRSSLLAHSSRAYSRHPERSRKHGEEPQRRTTWTAWTLATSSRDRGDEKGQKTTALLPRRNGAVWTNRKGPLTVEIVRRVMTMSLRRSLSFSDPSLLVFFVATTNLHRNDVDKRGLRAFFGFSVLDVSPVPVRGAKTRVVIRATSGAWQGGPWGDGCHRKSSSVVQY